MAKVHYVTLGGTEYPLAYTARDAIALKRRFGKPLRYLLLQDVMGMLERPKTQADCGTDEIVKPGDTVWEVQGTHDLEVQIAFLHAGIVSGGARKVTEDQVIDWITEHMKTAGEMGPVVLPVWRAVALSGIIGTSRDVDVEGDGSEGKA